MFKNQKGTGMVVYALNPNTGKAEASGFLRVQDYPGCIEFPASEILSLNNNRIRRDLGKEGF